MLLLGLTGSIGMGKSTTATLFAEAGVPVYDADATVHMLYEGEAVPAIEAAFPGTTANGKVDRSKLSARVVHDPAAIKRLEQIVHPMLGASRQKFLDDAERSGAAVAVVDVPLLFETGGEKRVDAVVVVTTAPELQRQRILARDNMTSEKLDAILARQLPDAEKRRRADFVVDTSDGLDPVRLRIRDILNEAVKMPRRRSLFSQRFNSCAKSFSIPKPRASTRCGATGWLKSAVSRSSIACRRARTFTGISIRSVTCRRKLSRCMFFPASPSPKSRCSLTWSRSSWNSSPTRRW